NGTLVLIFLKDRNLRTVPNTYIISLALGDLLVLFFVVPFVSVIYTFHSYPFGDVVCKLTEFMRDVSIGVTVFTLMALSADRYLAIVSSIRRQQPKGSRTVIAAVSIWVISVVLALPSAVISQVEEFGEDPFDNNNNTTTNATTNNTNNESLVTMAVCFPFPETLPEWYPPAIVLLRALVYYFVPLGVISVFYVLMATHLLLSAGEVPVNSHHSFDRQLKTRKKVAKIVLCFVIIFAVCFLPTHVFLLWFYLQDQHTAQANFNLFWHLVRVVGFCLSFGNSCINPIALYCISGNFRNRYNQYLFCCCSSSSMRRRRRRRRETFTWSFMTPGRPLHPLFPGRPLHPLLPGCPPHSHSSLTNSRLYSPSATPLTPNYTPSLNDAYHNDECEGHDGSDCSSPGGKLMMMMVVEDRDVVDSNTCIYEEVQL
ncbi:hypothetical protein Pcinc_041433, partial [Petrolisthes cinctipes]